METALVESVESSAQAWATQLAEEAIGTKCTTVGLTSGSRQPNDVRAVYALARSIAEELLSFRTDIRMLVLRLDVVHGQSLDRAEGQSMDAPKPTQSLRGPWSELTIPVPVGNRASWSLERLPRWLPVWKSVYSFLLIDLGPINKVPSRVIGRLCDSCYVLLGPGDCASHEWILQHAAWHDRSGSSICGTLVTTIA